MPWSGKRRGAGMFLWSETGGAAGSLKGMKLSAQEEEMVHLSLSDRFVSPL